MNCTAEKNRRVETCHKMGGLRKTSTVVPKSHGHNSPKTASLESPRSGARDAGSEQSGPFRSLVWRHGNYRDFTTETARKVEHVNENEHTWSGFEQQPWSTWALLGDTIFSHWSIFKRESKKRKKITRRSLCESNTPMARSHSLYFTTATSRDQTKPERSDF